jgi:DNA-binding MarR family transcriptional regulator
MGQLYDDVVAPTGLRSTQHGLLAQVISLNEPTMRELAEALVMDLSALGHALKPLARDGLVKLVPDVRDRRAKRVMLTAAGHRKFDEAMRLWQMAHDSFETAFGPKRAAELRAALSYIASDEFSRLFAMRQDAGKT